MVLSKLIISCHLQDLGPEITAGGTLRPLPSDLALGDIRVVLVAPKTEANIGAAARACGNFEVDKFIEIVIGFTMTMMSLGHAG